MKETINDELYKELAYELDVPEKTIKDVILNGQSKCTAQQITNNSFNNVRWQYFGAFKAKHNSLQVLKYLKGLNPIQRQFFLQAVKRGDYKRLREQDLQDFKDIENELISDS